MGFFLSNFAKYIDFSFQFNIIGYFVRSPNYELEFQQNVGKLRILMQGFVNTPLIEAPPSVKVTNRLVNKSLPLIP